jgi:hypothetical protein
MAYLVRRSGDRFDLREAAATPAGPRSRTLATFRPPPTPEILERAAARATRPFDRAALLARAAELGVATIERREGRAARELLALRDLLRLSDRIVRSRGAVRSRPKGAFPRFSSRRGRRRPDAARAR